MLHFLFKTTQLMHSALPLMNIDVTVVYSRSDIKQFNLDETLPRTQI